LRNVVLGVTDLLRLGAIHIDVQQGLIELLLDAKIHGAGNEFQLVEQVVGDDTIRGKSLPTTWTSMGAGNPKSRIWLTMSAGRL
jgi:hypothetical protein